MEAYYNFVTGNTIVLEDDIVRKRETDDKWYDKEWFNCDWIHINGGIFDDSWYDKNWYDMEWFNKEWFDKKWLDRKWFNRDWFNSEWFNIEWYDRDWYDRAWYDRDWFNSEWFNIEWYDRDWYDRAWYDRDWYDIDRHDRNYHKTMTNIEEFLMIYDFRAADHLYINNKSIIKNNDYINIKKKYIKLFFDDPNNEILSDEKYSILASDEKYTLIIARAWTGKSTALKFKTKFLYRAYQVDPLYILIFAFNSNTAKAMNLDIKWVSDDSPWIPYFDWSMTFHRFAGTKILWFSKNERESNVLWDDKKSDGSKSKLTVIQDIISEVISKNDQLMDDLYQYFRKEVDELERWMISMSKIDYYDVIRNSVYEDKLSQETLNGEIVKSVGEKWIADFLFEYDIKYKYESVILANKKKQLDKNYFPDFLLIDFEVIEYEKNNTLVEWESIDWKTWLRSAIAHWNKYPQKQKTIIEHWWIDLNNPKQTMPRHRTKTWEEYRCEVEWKRNFLSGENYSLIETWVAVINYSSMTARTEFENFLKNRLENVGILCKKLPIEKIIEKVKHKYIVRFTELCTKYITKAKQKWFSSWYLIKQSKITNCSDRANMFYILANQVYWLYENYLNKNKLIDMEDVLQNSIKRLDEVGWDIKIKRCIWEKKYVDVSLLDVRYLMVDEYQDCNRLFYEIIDRIRLYIKKINVVCVWDDRQLINGFAWSDIQYFKWFEKIFSPATILFLRETFRCPDMICQLSNEFYGEEDWSYSHKKWWDVKWFYLYDLYVEMKTDDNYKNGYEQDTKFFPGKKKHKLDGKWEKIQDGNGNPVYLEDDDWNVIYEYKREMYNLKYARYVKNLFNIIVENFRLKKIFILYRTSNVFGRDVVSIKNQINRLLLDWMIMKYKIKQGEELEDKKCHIKNKKKFKDILEEKIEFMTIHKSKWLEADLVILLEIWTNKFPLLHPDNELNVIFWETIKAVIDEEKRLFYVAMTRTKNKLQYISEIPIVWSDSDFLIRSWNWIGLD